jgi:multidrug efflux system membrane fusion protein
MLRRTGRTETLMPRPAPLAFALALFAAAPVAAAQPAVETPPVSVVAAAIAAQPHRPRLVLRGRTEADRQVEVKAQVPGLVVSEPIRKGALVEAGASLCVLDPGERPAALAEAEAALKQAELDYSAGRTLAQRGFSAETEILSRGAKLEAARAMVQRARIEIARLTIAAPFAGALESDTAELGALLQPGDVCASLIALDPIALVGFAAERDVEKLAVGAPAAATLVTGRRVEGRIRFVSRAADPDTRTYRVEVEVANPDFSIRDGMSAEIAADLAPVPAHLIPRSALTLGDDGRLGVRLVEDGRARFAAVATLGEAPGGVWVAGLPDPAEVILVGQEFVGEGMRVTVSPAAEREAQP